MKRLPPFPARTGPRGLVRAEARQHDHGRLSVRVAVPSHSGRDTVVDLTIPEARDALAAIGEALADARSALNLICIEKPHPGRAQKQGDNDVG